MKKSKILLLKNQNLKSFINCWIWRSSHWLCKAISSLENKLSSIFYKKINTLSFKKYSSADLLTFLTKGSSWLVEVVILIVNKSEKILWNWLSRKDLNKGLYYQKLICGKEGVHLAWLYIQTTHKFLLLEETLVRLKLLKIVRDTLLTKISGNDCQT